MSFIRKFVREQQLYGTCPFTTDHANLQLTLNANTGRMRWLLQKCKMGMCYIHFVVLWLQLFHEIHLGSVPIVVSLKSFLYAVAMAVAAISKHDVNKRASSCVELFNLFLQFERRHIEGMLEF